MMVIRCDGAKYVSVLFSCRTISDLILRRTRINQCQAQKLSVCLELLAVPTHKHTRSNSRSVRCSLRVNFSEYDYLWLFAKPFNCCYHRFQNRSFFLSTYFNVGVRKTVVIDVA